MRWSPEQLAEYEKKRANDGALPSRADPPFAAPADDAPVPLTITMPGMPQGKGRPRASVRGGIARLYTPEKTRSYEGMIRSRALDLMTDRQPLEGPVELVLRAQFIPPLSWSKRKQERALVGDIQPTGKPDLDNIAKAWSDALNGVAFKDDAQIVRLQLEKRYGPSALVVATVRAL